MNTDIEMLANLHEFGGMLAYTVMQHNPITHQNEEVESTFSRPHADDLAGQSTWVRWVVKRMVHFRGFADAQVRSGVAAEDQYTESPPTEPGYYWFKHYKGDTEPGVLFLDADGIGFIIGLDGAWKGGGPVGTLFGPKIARPK